MATSLEKGAPQLLPQSAIAVTTPAIPEPHPLYKEKHPERCKRFSDWEKPRIFELGAKPTHQVFRHRLYHEAESVFWLILYWVMFAQPEEKGEGKEGGRGGEQEKGKKKKKRQEKEEKEGKKKIFHSQLGMPCQM